MSVDSCEWGTCYGRKGHWRDLSRIVGKGVAFAQAHGRKVPSRSSALRHVETARVAGERAPVPGGEYLAANKNIFQSVFYFQVAPSGGGCAWRLNTPSDYSAYGAMGKDTANFTY